MTMEEMIQKLNDIIADPMWANHAEVNKHFLRQVRLALSYMPDSATAPASWEGGEGWESLAFALAEDEHDDPHQLIWEGYPPEPWGEVWQKYEGEAKRLIGLVHKHVAHQPPASDGKNPEWCPGCTPDNCQGGCNLPQRGKSASDGDVPMPNAHALLRIDGRRYRVVTEDDCRAYGDARALAATKTAVEKMEEAMIGYGEHDRAIGKELIAALASAGKPSIDDMVNRFIGWKLPSDFAPDCGISFQPLGHPNGWPIGTNLLTVSQAKAMFEYCLAGAGAPSGLDAIDAARYRYTQQEGYFCCGPFNSDGDFVGYSVGVQKKETDSVSKSVRGRGDTFEEALDAAIANKEAVK